ncbi:hypothetical protein predicted by Glimmer/Critica [Sorangium cellulosum So ce56]|uniref:RNA polymerase sigma-70 region 2 domain-containing protein n=1 Tax=Sorangium cellulosum (strain So ce56) TaxID=448385 RepID=A9GJZ8_SORC5|nr:sigma factor [Sorangium cellulosum]CAN96509.1 hypothetical protein predicted by Glimmer/Critica [Sorangium cellulosum So ce56]
MDVSTSASLAIAAPGTLGSDRFRRLARAMRVPAQDVDDILQDAWLRILENRARIGLVRDAAAYVDQLVRNVVRNSRRRSRRRQEVIAPLQEMLELGTTEEQLSACRLLHEHRERRGRGENAADRDALLRRVRCERHGSIGAQR